MPVVTREQLKTWFSNLKKPPEGEFWAWIDSFRHKMEQIPMIDITGLISALQKKADLVDGVVPESQLPFSVVTSEVITLGTVSLTDNILNLDVHSSGANKVRVKGKTITRTFENNWNTTPIADNGVKVVRGYAVKNEDDFFISEGAELPEFELPEIPEDALQLFIVTITNAGATIDTGGEYGFKYKAESGWKSLVLTSNNPRWITLTSDESMFDITEQNASMPLISGILTKGGKWIYPGKTFGLFNASGRDVKIERNDLRPPFNPLQIANYLTFPVGTDITIKPGEYFWFKIKGLELVILSFGGGAKFPEVGNNADVLVKDATTEGGAKWSNRLTNAESAIDTETVNRAIADGNLQGQINTHTGQIAGNTAAIAGKVDKPTADGTWSLQKFGSVFTWVSGVVQNIANTDLTNISARVFTQANAFTWNTAGFFYYLKGLVDKTGNAAYTKVVVVHPTTGEMVTRDFADPAATTLAIQNTNGTQLTQIRTKIFGSTTPASPVLTEVSRQMIVRNESTTTDLFGLNLTLLDPTAIYVIRPDNQQAVYATYFANVSTTIVTTNWLFPSDMPLGDYDLKIALTNVPQGISNAKLSIVNSTTDMFFNCQNWIRKLRLKSSDGLEVTPNGNYNTIVRNGNVGQFRSDVTPADASAEDSTVSFKGPNILDCSLNAGWTIEIECSVGTNGGGSIGLPLFGLTKTTDAEFTDIQKLLVHSAIYRGNNVLANNTATPNINPSSAGNWIFKLYIDKPKGTNMVYWRAFSESRQVMIRYSKIVEPTMYALFYKGWQPGIAFIGTYDVFTVTKFKNLS